MSAEDLLAMVPHSRVILGDSILRNVRNINDSNVISLSGSNFADITNLIMKYPIIISNAKSILIHCGTNHITKDPPNDIMIKFCSLIKAIKEINSDCAIVISSILPRPLDDNNSSKLVIDVNKLLKLECRKQNLSYIATNKLFLKYGSPLSDYFYDGLHLSPAGVMRLRQMFLQRLSSLGNKPTTHTSVSLYFKRFQWSRF
jgi:lysophospholipase L1-like esterase